MVVVVVSGFTCRPVLVPRPVREIPPPMPRIALLPLMSELVMLRAALAYAKLREKQGQGKHT